MDIVSVGSDRQNIERFVKLPQRLYAKACNMENPAQTRALLQNVHPLSKYFALDAYVAVRDGETVGRFAITTYEGDPAAYLGFFECVNDREVSAALFARVEELARQKHCTRIIGPVDASFWLKYRLKVSKFDAPPYTGEPYNKDYYPGFFEHAGYTVCERYVSNAFRPLGAGHANEQYERRYEECLARGYRIESPAPGEYERTVDEVYGLVTALYKDFPVYKPLSREDFRALFMGYRRIMNMSMTKMAYYEGEAAGFLISLPDYGSRVYHAGLWDLPWIAAKRRRPDRFVMLYMGVDRAHRGLGRALAFAVMKELRRSGVPSIGALVREGKVTQQYASADREDVYEYVLLERLLT